MLTRDLNPILNGVFFPYQMCVSCIVVLSGVYNPTSLKVSGELYSITTTLKSWENQPFWSECIYAMKQKYLKYYKDIPILFSCVAALDPAIGIDGVESLLEEINRNIGNEDENSGICMFNDTLNYASSIMSQSLVPGLVKLLQEPEILI